MRSYPVVFNGVLQSESRFTATPHGQLAGPHLRGAPRTSVRACHAQHRFHAPRECDGSVRSR
jgi:hypothetical protein